MPVHLNALRALNMYWAVHLASGADTTRVVTCAFRCVIYTVGGARAQAGCDAHYLGPAANGARRQDHRLAVRLANCPQQKLNRLALHVRLGLRCVRARSVLAVKPYCL